MIASMEAFAARWNMLRGRERVLVALSGGMDSMCLLHALAARGTDVCAAHFNHQLRGAEADADERFVREWCQAHGVPLLVGTADVAALARARGQSVEEAGRAARYAFLERAADELGAQRIATAHHARDNAETLLHHLARGTGTGGLAGIAPVRGRLIRPLLATPYAAIEDYARQNGVPYRTDASNADTGYTRNFIRCEILPRLETVNPNAETHLAEAALRLRREDAFLDGLAAQHLSGLERAEECVSLPCRALTDAPEALRARMLRQMLAALGASKKDFTARHFESLEALAEGTGAAQLDLPGGVAALRRGGMLSLRRAERPAAGSAVLTERETLRWGGWFIRAERGIAAASALTVRADAFPLTVGAWDPRARLRLPGAPERSLKRLYAERGIAPEERDRLPVFYSGGRAAAAYGLGTDEAFLPRTGEQALLVRVEKIH